MPLPVTLDKTTPAGSDLPSTLDNKIRNLTLAIEDLFGIPDATAIAKAGFLWAAAGLSSVNFALATSKIVPGATSLSLRNNADNTDNWLLTDAGNGTLRGNFVVSGAGPHAIGGATSSSNQLVLRGTYDSTGQGAGAIFQIFSTYTVDVNASGYGLYVAPTLNKAGSGTHADFVGLRVDAPTIGAGAAALTNASTLKIMGAPSVGTNRYSFWDAGGAARVDGNIQYSIVAGTSPAGTVVWHGGGSVTTDLVGNVPTGGLFRWNRNNSEDMRLSAGILALGTTVTTSASAGDLVLANAKYLRGVNAGGVDTARLIGLDGNSVVQLGQATGGYLPALPNTTAIAAAAALKGAMYADTGTAGQLVFFDAVTGARYKLVGTAF